MREQLAAERRTPFYELHGLGQILYGLGLRRRYRPVAPPERLSTLRVAKANDVIALAGTTRIPANDVKTTSTDCIQLRSRVPHFRDAGNTRTAPIEEQRANALVRTAGTVADHGELDVAVVRALPIHRNRDSGALQAFSKLVARAPGDALTGR